MRKIGVICGITALLAVTFFSPPATAFSIRVGSFYIHVPLVRHHHHNNHLHSSSRTGVGETEESKHEPTSTENCSGVVPGLTNLPIDQIRRAVNPTAEQEAAFDDLGKALSQASDAIKSACPSTVPLTPTSRLEAAEQRLDAGIKAAQVVRPPLVKLYEELSEEQRRQFETTSGRSSGVMTSCRQQAGSFINLPVQRIETVLEPTPQQQRALDDLRNATKRAADQLQSSCPTGWQHSPVARLDMVEARLKAIADAMKMVRPALESFYAALNDEQKARFNIVGPKG